MLSSDTITLQSSYRNCMVVKRLCPGSNGQKLPKFVHLRNDKLSLRWNTGLQVSGFSIIQRPFFMKPVATISKLDNSLPDSHKENMNYSNELQSSQDQVSVEDFKEIGSRINGKVKKRSNKGKAPWNKGIKHSPETIARIRERTKLAMQDLKVRKKIEEYKHHRPRHSEEAKKKIATACKIALSKHKLKEACLFEWKETIAEAARLGCDGKDELQWDSYEILKIKIHQDWLQTIQLSKKGPKGPKSVEHKIKLSATIKTKWADPDFRQRVLAGQKKYHKNRLPTAVRNHSVKVDEQLTSQKSQVKISKYSEANRRKPPIKYSDPLVNTKLDKLKQLRGNQEKNKMTRKEAVDRARLLIAKAEKSVKALEAAAMKDKAALAALLETKKLLAEAEKTMQILEPVKRGDGHAFSRSPQTSLDEKTSQAGKDMSNSSLVALTAPGLGDKGQMDYLSFSNTCKADNYDRQKSNNGTLSGSMYQYAREPGCLPDIGGEKVFRHIASQISTRNLSAEESALIFNLMSDKRIEKDNMYIEECSASTSMTVNYAGTVNKSSFSQISEAQKPEDMKDNISSVTTNSIGSSGSIQNMSELSEFRSFNVRANDILVSNKDVKKRWVQGRLIEVKGD